jgi:SPP1 gp7 family putative phage head morphogenesis protein
MRVAQVITGRATRATLTKGWRDQGTREPQSRYDITLALAWVTVITAAIRAVFTPGAILAAIFTARQHTPTPLPADLTGVTGDTPGDPLPDGVRDAIIQSVTGSLTASDPNLEPLRDALTGLEADALLAGTHAATEQLDGTGRTPTPGAAADLAAIADGIDWHDTHVSTPDAEQLLRRGGLGRLLDDAGISLKGITDTTVKRLGERIADGLEAGHGPDRIARDCTDILDDPKRALRIAHTETARAMTRATLLQYEAAGITRWDWTASDGACPACAAREQGGPYELGAPAPPQHPACRCSARPAADAFDD